MNDELQATAFDNYLAGGSIGIRSAAGERLPDFNATLVKSLPFNDTFPTIKLSQSWVQRRGRFQAGPVGIPDKTQGTAALNFATVGRLSLADVDVEANVDVPAITGRFASLVARCSGPGQLNMYHATVFFNGEKFEARISKTVGGVTTLLASVEIGSGSGMLRFLVVGTKLTLFFGGAEVLSAFDFSLTSGGVGIRSSVDSTFDNFRVSSPGS
jgi:hypothetical protein